MSRELINHMQRVSKLLQPIKTIPKDGAVKGVNASKSYQLMIDMGIIRQSLPGMYTLLPLGNRALDKLKRIVNTAMESIGAQKIVLPNLTDSRLWKKTGRLNEMGDELFLVKDRHKQRYVLSPTYEESITSLVADVKPQKSHLPLLLYQISNKWRDEMKPRLGLFRGREFVMKDLYSFDASAKSAGRTYEDVARAYRGILDHIGVPYSIVQGDTGIMGGIISHEYHYLADIGEDTVVSCNACNFQVNSVIFQGETCKNCGGEVSKKSAIEIGHTFLLGTKYSEVLQATVHTQGSEIPLVMGCYGLGLTRLLAASLEILSTNEDLRWPKALAPYTVCIIPPKENSKESPAAHFAYEIAENLMERNIDVIFDDRTHLTIGRRMLDARRTGYPYVVVVGRSAVQETPLFEFHDVNEGEREDVSLDRLYNFFENSASGRTTRSQIAV
ncbi:probable proline--tRNA ligase, mitochondrial [Fopius arisanus]|uniref:proline--tRNA ligase n=1 Tax=Fopius arisanus TaxID=64838 RepID=A0A9R1T225_9HYME|nr:PREDICTED: probable proline--tRNA ligase, mitochondrial [Fopius arisanus]